MLEWVSTCNNRPADLAKPGEVRASRSENICSLPQKPRAFRHGRSDCEGGRRPGETHQEKMTDCDSYSSNYLVATSTRNPPYRPNNRLVDIRGLRILSFA